MNILADPKILKYSMGWEFVSLSVWPQDSRCEPSVCNSSPIGRRVVKTKNDPMRDKCWANVEVMTGNKPWCP